MSPLPPSAAGAPAPGGAPRLSARQRAALAQLGAFVVEHLDEEDLTIERLAAGVGLSRATLYRHLEAARLGTPYAFVREARLARAAALLTEGARDTVAEVAYAVGFRSPSHFSQRFRERFGQTPSAYAAAERAR